ncbi:ABC transporter permease/M1 family aminopeptidase [Chryseobacterium lathyri]|uniref:ABC-type transport system involved in multi-copper enzyme maturation permease subunit n=1 Tax=Chryseobacterium lathyri TaxID=395933 RepID=A0ABT9SPT1_9FLAO|nr:M1 family aminopeptidase [Chryseobacterium lathyri]MDP9960864.1 ABC-type transport system involved in multi-copper enzyme maturation permease subunit [Chryseobacterium lathyri]
MNALFLFEAGRISKHWPAYLIALILTGIGIFCGNQFNLTAGDGIYLNSPYTIGFMTGMLSLSILFIAVIYAVQLLFKDWDSKFDLVLFSFPFSKWTYLSGRFTTYFLQTFLSFFFLMTGFLLGQVLRTGSEMQPYFNIGYYLYPMLIFGLINCFFVCSFLFFISLAAKKKLLVVVGGLLLYVLYMVVLVFSNSPFMAGSQPQSVETQQISSILDPFGLSSYFFEAGMFSVHQKNTLLVPATGYLLLNRIIFLIISAIFLLLTYHSFSFSNVSKQKVRKAVRESEIPNIPTFAYRVSQTSFGRENRFRSILSFAKVDLLYLFRSVSIPAVSILLLFFVGMEMYAEIEKGIRLPQKYVGSGLMATTISENFPLFGLLLVVYFINDLYWRSHSSGFSLVEDTAFFSKNKLTGHFISISIFLFLFTGILILEGILFQVTYQYFHLDWNAYLGVFFFNTFPLMLFSGFILLINNNIRNKFIALGISVLAVFTLAGPASGKILSYPLLRIFSDFKGSYSDFNGYGPYIYAFTERLLFGAGIISFLWMTNGVLRTKKKNTPALIFSILLLFSGIFTGILFMKGYIPKNKEQTVLEAVQYEKQFKGYENLPQPEISEVTTEIKLYPSKNSYEITGKYILTNGTGKTIDKILIHFHPDLKIESAVFQSGPETAKMGKTISEIKLKHPMKPNGTAYLDFKLSYKWYTVNGHQSFNAIIENGSFMRISRYYPVIGYQKDEEIQDEKLRQENHLGKLAELKKPEAPEVFRRDFINLDMTISTEGNQTAIGTGDLVKKWKESGRHYFQYRSKNIPFRFAVSSADYLVKSILYKGITVNVFYHKEHFENTDHLLENAKITLDYCIRNFGKYPFKTVNFAEISSFTRGFAATAYPSAIFMPEDMVFHANIQADKKQDVINELAGHELSHLWWGNSQIDPDDREGSAMLTETLAMYTEMMLYKNMHGKEKMMERIKVHQQIYDNEKGLSENRPIYRAIGDTPHISYSKGAVAMVKLSELIGEEKVNGALKNFLQNNGYPKKPSSLELLREFYRVCSDAATKKQVDLLFKTI